MRMLWVPAALLAAAGVVWPAQGDYAGRRAALAKSLPDGVVVLFGRTAAETEDYRTGFRQEPGFAYLSGWNEPGAVLLIAPPADILFLPRHNPVRERYTGRRAAGDDAGAAALTGFGTVLPLERLEEELRKALDGYAKIYSTGDAPIDKLKKLAPLREVLSASPAIAKLRMTNSPGELALLRRSAEASIAAHRAAWQRAAPGLYEYQVAATMLAAYLELGCERSAYPPIVGSGPNALILHYEANTRRMDKGELLLMDAAAECGGYAADITRTIPVGGAFTKRQREVYEIVLGAEKAAIAAVKPGVRLADLTKAGREYIDAHGKDLHGDPLGKYFTHGITHHVGLEVHDASDLAAPLAENMVITIEPGLYIPEENIGIRIEDMVLVTKDGAEVLTASLPREAREIERALSR